MDNKTKKWGVVIVVILILLGLYWFFKTSNITQTSQSTNQSTTTESTANPTNTTALSLNDARKLYEGRRMQFNQNCITIPPAPTFKVGTTIMLENGANVARVISLDNAHYTIKAYGYVLVTLTTAAQLPHTIPVDCGSGQNNATILLQK